MKESRRGLWTGRIEQHNLMNGVIFSIVELTLVAAVGSYIAFEYAIHGWTLGVVLAVGVVTNAGAIVVYGLAQLRRGESGSNVRQLFDAANRAEVRRRYPALGRETVVLTASLLAPYFLTVAVVLESVRH